MPRILSMTLAALLAAACVQVGSAPSGSPVVPSALAKPGAPSVSATPTTPPGRTEPTRTRRPRPQRTDRPTRPPTQPPTRTPTASRLPDLVIESFTVPESVADGEQIEISLVIRNVGEAATGPFQYVFGGSVGAGRGFAEGLGAGEMLAAVHPVGTAPQEDTSVNIRLIIDSDDEVAESDERNNEAAEQVQVDCGVLCREGLIRAASRPSA